MYVLVLLFLSGLSTGPVEKIVRCPNSACVHEILSHAGESRMLSRIRVWRAEDAYLTEVSKMAPWQPIFDQFYL